MIYQEKSVMELREIAKERKMKGISALKKKELIEALEAYDQTKGTHFEEILKMYLSFDGSVQKVAEASYVHRNTVNYQINRIKKILGRDLGSMEERLRILLAFQIQEIL